MPRCNHNISLLCSLIALLLLCSQGASAQPFGLTARVPVSGVTIPLDNPESGQFSNPFSPSLNFSSPVFVTAPNDATNRLFVVEQSGRIKVFQNQDRQSTASVFLDIVPRVVTSSEQGLLGMAFHPNYSSNGYFYLHYTAGSGTTSRSVISRFSVSSGDPNVADPTSEKIILQVSQVNYDGQTYGNHKGGMIAFGPDNMLYIALGDGGGGGDSFNTGQDCSDMLGNILRINPSTTSAASPPYTIPVDNPFAASENHNCGLQQNATSRACGSAGGVDQTKICREIWAYGLRNPFRFSFDRSTGNLWVGDVGQSSREEVDVVNGGDNMGWPVWEGTTSYRAVTGLAPQTFIPPVLDYGRGSGSTVTGGYVYRGSKVPSLYGRYIYGDFGSGTAWALSWSMVNRRVALSSNVSIGSISGASSFGEDKAGELYQANYFNGTILRVGAGQRAGSTPVPTRLSATGLFANLTNLTPAPGIIEYDVNAPLWSDGAQKKRWMALPGTSMITFSSGESYDFPTGTALIKHFEKPGAPTTRLETRVFFKHNQGWAGYTYKWNAAGTDADLLGDAVTENGWYYPSRSNCLSCHTASAGSVLGVRTRQLHGDFVYPAATDNQLRAWNHIGLFSSDIGATTNYEAYPKYDDATKSISSRSRAYLAANCSMCHNPAEVRTGVIDLRYSTAENAMNVINQAPVYGDLGVLNAARVRPGSPTTSILYLRMDNLGQYRMPPLATSLKDTTGLALVASWINDLSGVAHPSPPQNLQVR